MVWSRNNKKSVRQERLSRPAFFLGNTREPLQPFRIDVSEMKACLCAVLEDDGIEDFAGSGRESQRDLRYAEDGLTLRDLLFDETD